MFFLEPSAKDTYDIALKSAIKKSKIQFERYDPIEMGRLPAKYAIRNVCFQDAMIARLLAPARKDSLVHNTRVAFCAGIALGLEREFLLLQDTEDPVPLDYRDLVTWVPAPDSIATRIGELALSLWDHHHSTATVQRFAKLSLVAQIDVGSPIAENESHQLANYYLTTAEFERALRAEYQAITGRKGSGKTAFFIEFRNALRRNPTNIILDLQPEGYQLLKFREATLKSLAEGSKQHLLTALWEYVLLLETAYRILREDKGKHINNHQLLPIYNELSAFISANQQAIGPATDGDFAERLEYILADVSRRVSRMIDTSTSDNTLTYPNITELLHRCDIRVLGEIIFRYARHKHGLWVLMDNLDKGWPATGLHRDDLTLVRCLQDALFKLEKPLVKAGIICRGILFLRSDVYDRLIEETSDKGKTLRASLDLSNPNVLAEIIRKRIGFSIGQSDVQLDEIWPQLCVSHVTSTGDDSFEYLVERSLMRPRCLIEMIRNCQSVAVTLQHDRIEESDLKDGIESYSVELATNIGLEIRDVYPNAPEIIYALLGSERRLRTSQVKSILQRNGLAAVEFDEFLDLLLRYGVLGLVDGSGNAQYIYNHRYEVRRLKATQSHLADDADGVVEINPAFWAALELERHQTS